MFSSVAYSSTLKVEGGGSSEMLVPFWQTTGDHTPQDSNIHIHYQENLESHTELLCLLLYAFSQTTYQCSRRQWRKADRPSIRTKIAMVRVAQMANVIQRAIPPTQPSNISPLRNTMFHSTSDSSATASMPLHSASQLHNAMLATTE